MSEVPETRIPERRNRNTWVIVLIVAAVALTLLCACLAAASAAGLAGWFTSGRVGLGPVIGVGEVEATRNLDQSFTVARPVQMQINNEVGTVQVRGTNTDQVVVRARVRAWGATQADAERLADQIDVTIQQQGSNQIVVTGQNPPQTFRRSPAVEITVEMPLDCALSVRQNVGEVHVEGLVGSAQVQTNVGEIEVRNFTVRENSNLTTSVGEIRVGLPRESSFNLDAQTNIGDITSDFNIAGGDEQRRGAGERLFGAVGEGPMGTLVLRANTGQINIEAE